MDRRDFLKLGILLPAAKSVIYNLFIAPQSYKDAVVRSNPIAYWPLGVANEYSISLEHDYSEPIFAPDPDKIGEFIEVGRTRPLLACDCYPELEVQIKTGHNDT